MPLCAKDSKGSHAASGKVPPWHQSQALHAPCLSFPTGDSVGTESLESTRTLSTAQPPPAQHHHRPRTSPPRAAGCRGQGRPFSCVSGHSRYQLGAAPAGTAPSTAEGAGTRQRWQSRAASPRLTGGHAHSSLIPGRMSLPCSLLSGDHPGGEAKLPHSLFWAAFPPPPPPRVLHSYCLCRNSAAINPPPPAGAARLCFLPPEPCMVCHSPPKEYWGSSTAQLEREEALSWKSTPCAHSHPCPSMWRLVPMGAEGGGGQEGSLGCLTRPPSWVTLTPRGHRGDEPL